MAYDRNKIATLIRDNPDLKNYLREFLTEICSRQITIQRYGEASFLEKHLDDFKDAFRILTGNGESIISVQRISDRRIIKEGAAIIYNGYPAKIEGMTRDRDELLIKVYVYKTKDYFSGVKLSEIEPVL